MGRLQRIDRRVIFAALAVAVLLPYLTGLKLGSGTPGPATLKVYNYLNKLPAGAVVMIAFDYGPAAAPELQPMAAALARHCFRRNLRLLAVTLDPQGQQMAERVLGRVSAQCGQRYGRTWVNLGYRPGDIAVIMGMGERIADVYSQDVRGTPLEQLPVMQGVRNYANVALLLDLAQGSSPDAWLPFAHERYRVPLGLGVTAVMTTDYYPYFQSGQIVGLVSGLRGAADYEQLVGAPEQGTLGMASQSVAHLVLIGFVALGNVGYYAARRRRRISEMES